VFERGCDVVIFEGYHVPSLSLFDLDGGCHENVRPEGMSKIVSIWIFVPIFGISISIPLLFFVFPEEPFFVFSEEPFFVVSEF
jgi:hypothetical protein